MRVSVVPAPTAGGVTVMMGGPTLPDGPGGQFTVTGVTPGRYRLTGNAPWRPGRGPGITWTLRSAMVKGRDVLDFPLDIGPGDEVADAVLTFTDATQQVAGVLQDASGRPAPDYTIMVFAGDKRTGSRCRGGSGPSGQEPTASSPLPTCRRASTGLRRWWISRPARQTTRRSWSS